MAIRSTTVCLDTTRPLRSLGAIQHCPPQAFVSRDAFEFVDLAFLGSFGSCLCEGASPSEAFEAERTESTGRRVGGGCVLSREGHVISLDAFWATPHVFHDSAVVRWSRRTRASTRLDLSPTKQALRLRLQQRANAASAFQTPVSKRVSAKHTFNVDSRPHTSIETYVQTSVSKTRERETHVQR